MLSLLRILFHRCRNHSGPWYRVQEGVDTYLRNFPHLGIGYRWAEDQRNCLICGSWESRQYQWPQDQPDPVPNILRLERVRAVNITPGGGIVVNDALLAKEVIEATRRDRD